MKMTIFKRMVIGNMIMISFVIFLGAYVIFKLDELQRLSLDIVHTDTKTVNICEDLSVSLLSLIMFEKKYTISKDIDYYNMYTKLKNDFEGEIIRFKNLLETPGTKKIAVDVHRLFQEYSLLFECEVELIKEQPLDYDSLVFVSEKNMLMQRIEAQLKQIILIIKREKDSKLLLSNSMIEKAITLTVMITMIAIALGILLSVSNTKAITGSIFLLEKKTREIARGQFNQIPSIISAPKEIEDLTRHFNVMCSRLKELEIMKTDFISHFSHELRTPVTSMKEASSMLHMQLFNSDPQKEKELSQLIMTECDRLIASIEKILDLSKMEVFKMEWKFAKADIVNITQKALVKFIPESHNKGIDLALLPAKDIPITRLDEKRIEEVLNNLISNALKYTPEGGRVAIKIENENQKKILVSVSDDGCGIDEQNLEKIFEKFKRIDKGNETLRGTGLGLSISKHIINAHKGEIWAESKISQGTTVSFTLLIV